MGTQHRWAVVTGASRGIGAAYARALAAAGYDLLLVSRDRPRLEELAAALRRQTAARVELEVLDLAVADAGQRLYAAIRDRGPAVELLVQNAGFGWFGPFAEMPLPRVHEMVYLHIQGVLTATRLLLPEMLARRSGAVILVASIAGLFPVPYLAEYAATKAFLIQFGRALAEEVRSQGVTVQVCCPGTTETEFHATARFHSRHPLGAHSPERVAAASLQALEKGPTVVTIGWSGRLLEAVSRVLPSGWTARAAARWMTPAAR